MKLPWYKRYLSYFKDVHLESRQGNVNPYLHVYLVKGRVQLCTQNAIYSFADLYDNFSTAFRLLKWDRVNIEEVLLLGFGLGSIPWMLEKRFAKNLAYTAVEPDFEVIDLATDYVLDELESPVQIFDCDAFGFMERNERKFDLICMDVFEDDRIPDNFLTLEYLEYLKGALNPGGVLLFNCLYKTEEDKRGTDRYYSKVFEKVFPEGRGIPARGNMMLTNMGELFNRE